MMQNADAFADELFLSARRRARLGMVFGCICLVIAAVAVVAVVLMLPLKERVPYVILMDPTTGKAEQLASVQALSLDEEEAIIQANLVSYVTDRETFDSAGAQERVNSVFDRSIKTARNEFQSLWSPASPDYPPSRYTRETRVKVRVVSVALLNATTAQVRFIKTRSAPRQRSAEGSFIATITFDFDTRDKAQRSIEDVWANPLGFVVSGYRVDAETLEPGVR